MEKYKVVGLMSGTSLDGLDMALCEFVKQEDHWLYECRATKTVGYDGHVRSQLQKCTEISAEALVKLDQQLGEWYGQQVKSFLEGNNQRADYIASHGHTVFHQPEVNLTYQIGNGYAVQKEAGIPVINNFRAKDVTLGGQGAPLVPIGDKLLFAEFDYCLNLGGIANVSFDMGKERVAFDICACNMALNHIMNQRNKPYDEGGQLARDGNVIPDLLENLNLLPYFKQKPPKSLGYEWVSEHVFPLLSNYSNHADILCTICEHIAMQIGASVADATGRMLVTGGGAFNDFLMERINDHAPKKFKVVIPDRELIEFKEAIVFAFLGVLRVRSEANCLASVTGAPRDTSGGVIYQ